jgi:hypothetical protein
VLGVEADEIRRVELARGAFDKYVILAVVRRPHRDRGKRDPGSLDGRRHPPRCLAMAELGAEKAYDVRPGEGRRRGRFRPVRPLHRSWRVLRRHEGKA